ncbi:MAG: Rieske (2Fe-2S) protein [Acidobacteriaceae bacterium]
MCKRNQLPPAGEAREFACADGRMVCVANVKGEITAMDNICAHRGGPLGQGTIEHGKLVCPWHGWAFDPRTGAAVHHGDARVQTYRIWAEGEVVKVEI